MASQAFTIINNQTISAPSITQNGIYTLYTSATQNNNGLLGSLPSMRLIADYQDLTPSDIPGGIGLIIEALNGSQWFPIAYQFESYRNSENGNQRIIMLQPNMSTFDDGIDSIVFVGNRTVARISRQQGRVGAAFRLRLLLSEQAYGTTSAFQSVKMFIYGELHDDA